MVNLLQIMTLLDFGIFRQIGLDKSVLSDNRLSMTKDFQHCMLTMLTFDDMNCIFKLFIESRDRKHFLKFIERIALWY